jgi:hypothetical protein
MVAQRSIRRAAPKMPAYFVNASCACGEGRHPRIQVNISRGGRAAQGLGSSKHGLASADADQRTQHADAQKVMVIVFGIELRAVNQAHGRLQPLMKREARCTDADAVASASTSRARRLASSATVSRRGRD